MTTFEIRSAEGRTVRSASLTGPGTLTERAAAEPGVQRYDVVADVAADGPVTLRWTWPAGDAVTLWRAAQGSRRNLPTDWGSHRDVRSVRSAPVAGETASTAAQWCESTIMRSRRGARAFSETHNATAMKLCGSTNI